MGELVPQEVYSRGGGYCDSEDGNEASAGHTRRAGRNVGATTAVAGGDERFVFEFEAPNNNNSG